MKFHEKPASFVSDLTIKVKDIEISKKFYQTILGFSILEENDKKVVFTTNNKNAILTIKTFGAMEDLQARRTGLYHFAILLPERKDLAKFIRHIIKHDYPLHGAADHDVSEALYLNDPDGNGIEVYYDRPSETWTWEENQVYMTTEQLDINDIMLTFDGTTFDKAPEKTVLGHIHLHVRDLVEAEHFYKNLLGLELVLRFGGQALFMSFDNYHHHIGLNTWNGYGAPPADENSVGMEYYTIKYGDKKKLDDAIERLENANEFIEIYNNGYFVFDGSKNKIYLTV